ncbi:MAG: DUF1850 domain-containing protein [Burkholderiales bacterium]|nr:DUF1850 domain-containing protein [Burkholderiales bacterium]
MSVATLCLVAGALTVAVPTSRFTLSWQHSVEKVLWEEDYLIAGGWLLATGARIRGSGAGMEPPAGSVLHDGAWHFRPRDRWLRELQLARSEFTPDYQLCFAGRCRPLAHWLSVQAGPTTLRPCP